MQKQWWGYAFSCPLTLEEMFQRLNALGPWKWGEWWSDTWGSMIVTNAADTPGGPETGYLRIMEDPSVGGFGISARLESEAPDWKERFERVRSRLVDELLPAMGAVILRESGDYGR